MKVESDDNLKIYKSTPPAYIICRNLDENMMFELMSGDTSLLLSYIKASYVYSKPTGFTNKAISEAFLRKGAPKVNLTLINTSSNYNNN